MPNMEYLATRGKFLTVDDMMKIFRVGRTTIWRYESKALYGFPAAMRICGQKQWSKKSVEDYIDRCAREAEKSNEVISQTLANIRSR